MPSNRDRPSRIRHHGEDQGGGPPEARRGRRQVSRLGSIPPNGRQDALLEPPLQLDDPPVQPSRRRLQVSRRVLPDASAAILRQARDGGDPVPEEGGQWQEGGVLQVQARLGVDPQAILLRRRAQLCRGGGGGGGGEAAGAGRGLLKFLPTRTGANVNIFRS